MVPVLAQFALIVTVLSSTASFAGTLESKLHAAIYKLQPKVFPPLASQLAHSLAKYSAQYKTDPYISLAIAMQESSLKQIDRVYKGRITDYGLFQFNEHTVTWMELDIRRLTLDVDYATLKHVKLLALKKKECRNWGNYSWLCYHSANADKAQVYKKLVDRYYFKLKPKGN